MSPVRVTPGEIWTIDDDTFVFKERIDRGLLFSSVANGATRLIDDAELMARCDSGTAVPPRRNKDVVQSRNQVFLMTDAETKELERKLAYVRAYERAPRGKRSGNAFDELIADVAKKEEDAHPPKARTVKQWKADLDAAFGNPRAIVRTRAKFPRSRRMRPLTFMAMVAYVEAEYLVQNGPSIGAVCKKFIKNEIPRLRAAHPHIAHEYIAPCENTVRAYMKGLDEVMVMSIRKSPQEAARYFRTFGRGPRFERPLQCVQIDTWKQNIIYVDRQGNPLGRLYFTAIIDCYSRMIVGFYIGPEAPRAWSVLQAVRHAMLPKDYVQNNQWGILSEWPASGHIELACMDQGSENTAIQVAARVGSLGTTLDYGPKGMPWDRGIIERFFGTMARGLIHQLPGTTLSGIDERGDYDAVGSACLTAHEIIRRIHKWIIDEYHNTVHSELGDTPFNVWKKGAQEHGVVPPPSRDDLAIHLCHRTTRTIQRSGIEINRSFYNAPELGPLKGYRLPRAFQMPEEPDATSGEHTVEVLFDEGDLGHIWVVDRRQEIPAYIKCEARCLEYSAGLTLWQDEAIRAELKQAGLPATDDNLVAKKDEVFARSDSKQSNRRRVNRGAARFQAPTAPLHGLSSGAPPSSLLKPARKRPTFGKPAASPAAKPTPDTGRTLPAAARYDLYDGDMS